MQSPNFFVEGSPYLNHPLLTPERTYAEIDYVLQQTQLTPGARILDVGCGPGRHCLELARRGFYVTGIDPSGTMIEAAVRSAKASNLDPAPEFFRIRAEDFTTERPFDGAICLFTTLGQMDESSDNASLLDNVFRALKPGGYFIVEVPNRDWVLPNLKPRDRFGNDENFTQIDRCFDPHSRTISEAFTLVSGGKRNDFLLRYRLYDLDEVQSLLVGTGFEIVTFHGGYDASEFTPDSPILLGVTRKT
jgi:SAM-dependent methyltransferase